MTLNNINAAILLLSYGAYNMRDFYRSDMGNGIANGQYLFKGLQANDLSFYQEYKLPTERNNIKVEV